MAPLGGLKPMTTEATTNAPSQAEAKAPTSDVKTEAGNLSGAEAAAMLFKQRPEAEAPPAEQTTTEQSEGAPPAAEEVQSPSAEAKPEEATAEEAEVKPEGEADDDLSTSTQIDPETRRAIAKKMGKEREKRRVLEGKLNELTARVLDLQQAKPETAQTHVPIPGESPLATVNDVSALKALATQADEAIEYCERVLDHIEDGGTPPEGWTKQTLKEAMRNANRTKTRDIPQRFQFLQERNKAQQQAFQQFPFLKDRSSNEYLVAQQVRNQIPWVGNHPNGDLIVGLQVLGLKALYAQQEAAKKAAVKPKPALSSKPAGDQTAVSSGASATRAPAAAGKAVLAKATSELKAKGNATAADAAKFLLQSQLARNAR